MTIRNLQDISVEHVDDPDFASEMKTLRLGDAAGSEQIYLNIDFVKPGGTSCKYHSHQRQEEFFLILKGTGLLRLNGEEIPVKEGDYLAKLPGRGIAHQFINTGTEVLQILDCGTRVPDDVIEYPDEGVVYLRKEKAAFRKSDALADYVK